MHPHPHGRHRPLTALLASLLAVTVAVLASFVAVGGAGAQTSEPAPAPTPTPTTAPPAEPAPTPSPEPTPSPAPTPAPTPEPTPTPSPSPSPSPSRPTEPAGESPPRSGSPARTGPPSRTIAELVIIDSTLKLYKVKAELGEVDKDLADVRSRLVDAEEALAETEAELATAKADLAELRVRLQGRAAAVYQRQGDRLGLALAVNRVVDLSAGTHYAESVALVDNREVERLEHLVDELQTERNKRAGARQQLTTAKTKLEAQLQELQADVDQGTAEIEKSGGVPVLGPPTLTAPEVAAWFKSTGQRARLAGTTTIDDLAEMYISEGLDENVRGDLAFAQAVLETGSFGHAIDNNFSGIGACDSCTSQFLFPTPRDGVRAQIQFLLNYADPNSRAADLKHPPDPTLYSPDPVKAAHMFDTFFGKGDAPVWNVMGNGNWATDPLYAGKVLSIFGKMLEFKSQMPKATA